jgi:hypothetical protein
MTATIAMMLKAPDHREIQLWIAVVVMLRTGEHPSRRY